MVSVMPGSSSSVLEEEVLIFSVSKKWTSLLSGASMQQETQGEWVSFLPFSKGKGAQKQMLPDTNYSDLSPAPIPQGSCCQFRADSDRNRWTQQKKSYYRSLSPFSLSATMTCMHNTRRGAQGWDLKEEPGNSFTWWSSPIWQFACFRARIYTINIRAGCEF